MTDSAVWCAGGQIPPPPTNPAQPVEISSTTQYKQYGPWIHIIYLYIKLPIDHWFLCALCIIDFIGGNGLLGQVGGRGPWTLLGPNGTRCARAI
jgi:hypothetical protein